MEMFAGFVLTIVESAATQRVHKNTPTPRGWMKWAQAGIQPTKRKMDPGRSVPRKTE
jgi:hypothetical protein